jgi:hypothetical protein
MITRRAYFLILSAVLLACPKLRADDVAFNSANLGPSSVLQIGGITITDLYGVNQPVAVSGYGVGDVPGPLGSFIISGNNADSGLHLSVNGNFNSITVLPYAVDQNGTPVALNFALSYELYSSTGGTVGTGFPIRNIYLTGSSGPTTFATSTTVIPGTEFSSIDLAAIDNSGGASEANYIATHPGVTSLTYGYVIEAADVTFNVPDQSSSLALLAFSVGVLFIGHRARSNA